MENKKMDFKRIAIYVSITFALTYLYSFLVVGGSISAGGSIGILSTQMLVGFLMFFPAIGMLLTRIITKEGFSDLWIKPRFKGNIKYYIAAWLVPIFAIAIGAIIYFLIFPAHFDLNLGYMSELVAASGGEAQGSDILWISIITQICLAIFVSPILNFITCLGEEWGWRGYLLPKMANNFSFWKTCLISGLIWGLWHAPITFYGHNYGTGYLGYPFTGILAMICFCTVVGVFLNYVSLKAKSCIPGVIGHAMLNGFAASGTLFMISMSAINPFIGPAPIGIIGGIGFIITAAVCLIFAAKQKKSAAQ